MTFWLAYWIIAGVMIAGFTFVGWVNVTKEGEDICLRDLVLAAFVSLTPILNGIVLIITVWYIIDHNWKTIVFRGRK